MYFPYLRGRQYELIALRELIEADRLSDKIIPIIEPVKVTSTLLSTINALNEKNKDFIIIRNPGVGTFVQDSQKEKNMDVFNKIKASVIQGNVCSGLVINSNSCNDVASVLSTGVLPENLAAFCLESDNIENLQKAFKDYTPKYNIIPYSPAFRRVRNGKRVMLDDKFNKLTRNNDYNNCVDEFFSDDHIYCYEDGYFGFSDYSIVGSEYSESGFAPYAVAIHIVYRAEDNTFRVHHFVSDSNNDISDPANKFYEALSKLIDWNKEKKLNTMAMEKFKKMHDDETYPGLGVVKKLSIMHHIELVGDYLAEVTK